MTGWNQFLQAEFLRSGFRAWTLPFPTQHFMRKSDRSFYCFDRYEGVHYCHLHCKSIRWTIGQTCLSVHLQTMSPKHMNHTPGPSYCKQQCVFQDGRIGQSCSKKEKWFFQANLKLNSELAKAIDNATQGEAGMLRSAKVTHCILTRFLQSNITSSAE